MSIIVLLLLTFVFLAIMMHAIGTFLTTPRGDDMHEISMIAIVADTMLLIVLWTAYLLP